MVEVAPAPAAPALAKAPKKKAALKPKKVGPTVSDLIVKAVSASKERRGVSLPALKKVLAAEGYNVVKNNARVKQALRNLVTKETILHTKGIGAAGSFKLNKKVAKVTAKKAVLKPRKPAAKKPVASKKGSKATPKKPAVKAKAATLTKATKRPKKVTAKNVTRSPKKVVAKKATKKVAVKKVTKSPRKPKPTKPKVTSKVVRPKKTAPKKK